MTLKGENYNIRHALFPCFLFAILLHIANVKSQVVHQLHVLQSLFYNLICISAFFLHITARMCCSGVEESHFAVLFERVNFSFVMKTVETIATFLTIGVLDPWEHIRFYLFLKYELCHNNFFFALFTTSHLLPLHEYRLRQIAANKKKVT